MIGTAAPAPAKGPAWRRILTDPWTAITLLGLLFAAGASFAPRSAIVLAPAMALAGFLVWRHGLLRGGWFLFVLLLPLRGPLGVDVHGTVTLQLGDVLLAFLVLAVAWQEGLDPAVSRSPFLRGGLLLLGLGILGLPFATNMVMGAAGLQQSVLNVAAFCVARRLVRNGADATRTLAAFLVGLAPAVVWGLWESTIRVELWNATQWHGMDLEFDSAGKGHVRVQATFDNTLRFSHPLSVGFGLALGLWGAALSRSRRVLLLAVGVAAAWCNRYTYSVGGAVASAAAILAAWWVFRRRTWAIALPVLVAIGIAAAPDTLATRAGRVLQGDSTSAFARIVTYQQALRIIRDHPVTGVGWGGAQDAFANRYRISRAENVGFRAENYFLHRAVALGLPGLAVSLWLCFRHLRLLHAIRRREAPGGWPRDALVVGALVFWVQAMLYPVDEAGTNQLLWILFAVTESAADAGRAAPS